MILPFKNIWPTIHETAFVAPSADIVGDVVIGEQSSIWFQCVVRGDVNTIRVGNRTNVQDGTILHVTRKTSPLVIGDDVTVGHQALVHGCKVGNRVLIGMGAILLDDAEIGDDCIIGAGTLITKGFKVPSKSLVIGSPGKIVRELKLEEVTFLKKSADNYVKDSEQYLGFVRGPKRIGSTDGDLDLDEGDL